MLIVSGSSCRYLAVNVSKLISTPIVPSEYKVFPDGEVYVRINGDVSGKPVAIFQSFALKPNDYLMEFILLSDLVRDLGASKIIAVIPYFAYTRQDDRFKPGEALSIKTIASIFKSLNIDSIVTIDMHLHRISNPSELFKIPVYNLSAMGLLMDYVMLSFKPEFPIVIGPDEESKQWAEIAAKRANIEYDVLEKIRYDSHRVTVKPKRLNVDGKDVILVDDIISTGVTMVEAIKALRSYGARKIITACTHPILVNQALSKILEAGAEAVIGTDTVPSPVSYVSVKSVIAEFLRRMFNEVF
ncbi:MAG: ribose-phosphate diphosphokinase [Candidatus Methanomethylicia archaeon]